MKTLALILVLFMSGLAAAGYKEAVGALKNLDPKETEEINALSARPGPALARDARAAALLTENQRGMELFRQAAEETNDGYLFAPKPEKLNTKTPVPKFIAHVKLFRLLLIDAKVNAALKQPGAVEKDLLAVAGFMLQLSAQKSGILLSSLVEQLCMNRAYLLLSASLQNPSVSPAYLKELASRLDRTAKNQDFMRAALLNEAESWKGAMQEGVNPDTMAAERKKIPFWKRAAAKKLQDQEFFTAVYANYNAAVDAYAGVLTGAFRANDPAPLSPFMEKRRQEILARTQARGKPGFFSEIVDGMKGGPETKKRMAEVLVDTLLDIAAPSYEKLIPRYHLYYCQLNVLRSALAVKLYQRGARRLPESLGQLVPAYLDAVPQDSFNKFTPLSYVKAGRKFSVYSFGPDGKDGGGAAALDHDAYFEDPARAAGDITFAD